MYRITVRAEFCAAHALTISGQPETLHGHNWRVATDLEGYELDADGLLCDFHTVESTLLDILEPFKNSNLNETEAFATTNPTAELVARHIAEQLHDRLDDALAPHARIAEVRVTEAPGCEAAYRPDADARKP
ncbi:MAG: 6-carboxytetrahydropterin synthase [Planctomycetota bacterium]